MSRSIPSHSEPSKEDIDWYNRNSMYVGFAKPNVDHVRDPGMSYLERRREEPEQDYLSVDAQGYDEFKESE